MAKLLTARTITHLKPREIAYYVSDTKTPGFAIRVGPAATGGIKSWSVRYRIGRRQRRLTLGTLDVVKKLGDARKLAEDALLKVKNEEDPQATKQARRTAKTVGEFAETYIEKYAEPRKRSWKTDQARLNKDVLPRWKHRLLSEITRSDVRELLDRVKDRGLITANRLRALLHTFFAFAVEEEVIDANPVTDTARPQEYEQPRDRVLTPDEIRTFWAACEPLPATMRAAFRLRLLTAQRGGEIYSMEWVNIDLVSGWWTIPKERAKNGLSHRVPLAPLVLDILNALRSAEDARLKADPDATPSPYVLRLARGKRQQAAASSTFGIDDFHPHDLRRTAATFMASSGVSETIIGKILNHKPRGITATVYVRASYDMEKRAALDGWAKTLTAILEERSGKLLTFTA